MVKKRIQIGAFYEVPEHIKKEYLSKQKKHPMLVVIEISVDNKYGAIARIYERNSLFDRFNETITKKEREEWSKKSKELSKKFDNNKPVDTSKWVKPDEETIRNALIKCLFALHILKPDSPNYSDYKSKAGVLYSILHSHSPKNPQTLMNFAFGQLSGDYFEKIMQEFKVPEGRKHWDMMTDKKGKYVGVKKHRGWFKDWKSKCLKIMIIPDPNPPKFVDIFKKNDIMVDNIKNKINKKVKKR